MPLQKLSASTQNSPQVTRNVSQALCPHFPPQPPRPPASGAVIRGRWSSHSFPEFDPTTSHLARPRCARGLTYSTSQGQSQGPLRSPTPHPPAGLPDGHRVVCARLQLTNDTRFLTSSQPGPRELPGGTLSSQGHSSAGRGVGVRNQAARLRQHHARSPRALCDQEPPPSPPGPGPDCVRGGQGLALTPGSRVWEQHPQVPTLRAQSPLTAAHRRSLCASPTGSRPACRVRTGVGSRLRGHGRLLPGHATGSSPPRGVGAASRGESHARLQQRPVARVQKADDLSHGHTGKGAPGGHRKESSFSSLLCFSFLNIFY